MQKTILVHKRIQEQIHENFILHVKKRRGSRLNKNKIKEIFSGLFWVGQKAIDLGLADGIGSIQTVIRNRFGENAKIKIIEQTRIIIIEIKKNKVIEQNIMR